MFYFNKLLAIPLLLINLATSHSTKPSQAKLEEKRQVDAQSNAPVINNNFYPNITNQQEHGNISQESKMNNEQSMKSAQSMAADFKQHLSDFAKYIPTAAENIKTISKEQIIPSLLEHKKKIIFSSFLGIIFYITYKIQKTKNILNDQFSWSNWKQAISVQHLNSISYKELIPELLTDIQKKYLLFTGITPSKANQIALPYDKFTTEIKSELKELINYSRIYDELKRFKLNRLFFFPYDKEVITEKINRLRAILNIFASWQVDTILKHNK